VRILLTNDDGINAEGLHVMARAVSGWVAQDPDHRSAVICAPDHNYSGMSSAVGDVYEHPMLTVRRRVITGAENIPAYEIEGSPALCAIIGCFGTFGERPDLVLSGINPGANVGLSVLHSGTVGAVLTAAQVGISGIAVSVQWGESVHYDTAAALAVGLIDEIAATSTLTSINLNVPNLPLGDIRGVRHARISSAEVVAGTTFASSADGESGVVTLRLGAASPTIGDVTDEDASDDGALVEAGYAALTIMQGPRENTDLAHETLIRAALNKMSAHLTSGR